MKAFRGGLSTPEPAAATTDAAAASRLAPAYLALLAAGAALSFWFMYPVPLFGDESYYAQASAHLARALRAAAGLDFALIVPALKTLRGAGWFMPGMPVLLLPVTLVFGGEAPVWALRLWVLAVNVALLALLGRRLTRRFSQRTALVFLGVTLLSPYYVAYLSALWGDSVGILLVLLFVLWCDGHLADGGRIPAAKAGLLLAGIVYLRSLFLPLLLVCSAAVLLAAVREHGLGARAAARWAGQTLVAGAVFFALLAPWSAWQSARYGFTLTTTSVPLSQLILFGDPAKSPELRAAAGGFAGLHNSLLRKARGFERAEKVEGGPADAPGTVLAPQRKQGAERGQTQAKRASSRRRGKPAGSYMEVARAARDAAMEGVPAAALLRRVGANVDSYYLDPAGRLSDFVAVRFGVRPESESLPANAVFLWTTFSWFAVFLFVGMALAVPFDLGPGGYVPAVFFKAIVFILGLHPLYVLAHNRYHLQLIPLAGLLAALLAAGRFTLYRRASLRSDPGHLVAAGQLLAGVFAGATLALLVAF